MRRYILFSILFFCLLFKTFAGSSPVAQGQQCVNNEHRSWWNTGSYDLNIHFDLDRQYINGVVVLRASIVGLPTSILQLDLQEPMEITAIAWEGLCDIPVSFSRADEHSYHVRGDFTKLRGTEFALKIAFRGRPREALQAPWDGGVVYGRDTMGKHWWGVACQGIGASVWFPCKDIPMDEPDSVTLSYTVPEYYTAIGNGMLERQVFDELRRATTFTWKVRNPVNLYNITFYIGDYVRIKQQYKGAEGNLPVTYYCLSGQERRARKQFRQVFPMLECFEAKIGPYPFYEDGFKIVEAPYLGMEHQSAIAYGNGYRNGYKGKDRSGSGVGLLFDFIIVHESGHEWFGNSITASDVAYSWIQEGFTSYTETIFAECLFGKEQACYYQRGKRAMIMNDRSPEGAPGHCDGGSGDHYDKSAFMIHTLRTLIDDDVRFYAMIQDLAATFRHQVVDGPAVEQRLLQWTGGDIGPEFFDQYLRTAAIPVFRLEKRAAGYYAYWTNVVQGFRMPALVYADGRPLWIHAGTGAAVVPELSPDTEWIRMSEDMLADMEVR